VAVAAAALALINKLGYHYMAELLRTQGFRAQVSGVPGAATPAVSFGQQRRPDVAFQAQANYQQALAQSIDRMSRTAFGFAETFGQEAGQQYVIENAVTQDQLNAMVRGQMPADLATGSPFNVFSAAVRKARAIEVSGHVLAEGRKLANDLMLQAEEGKVDTEKVISDLTAFMNGAGSTLSQIDPDASLQFRANMATIGSGVVDKVARVELQRRQAINRAKRDLSYEHTLNDINTYLTKEKVDSNIYNIIASLEERFYAETVVMVSVAAAEGYRTQFRKDIENLKLNLVAGYVTGAEDPIAAFDQIRRGKTNNEFINSLVAPSATNRMAMLDAARKELSAFNTLEEQRIAQNERVSLDLQVNFADALASNNQAAMNNILDNLRTVNRAEYVKLKKVASEGGGVFAITDNGNVVADLERKLNNPYGPRVTVDQVFAMRNQLTQSSYSKYINAAKAMEDEQINLMVDQAASQLGMMRGAVLIPGAGRARQERIISDLKVKFFNERRRNPNVDVFDFLKQNFESTKKISSQAADNATFSKIQSFTYKSSSAFEDAIRNAHLTKNKAAYEKLVEQRNEFLDAVKAGIIDENGKRISREQ
jgi:hypothetical protein